jgi:hypothetical protein
MGDSIKPVMCIKVVVRTTNNTPNSASARNVFSAVPNLIAEMANIGTIGRATIALFRSASSAWMKKPKEIKTK